MLRSTSTTHAVSDAQKSDQIFLIDSFLRASYTHIIVLAVENNNNCEKSVIMKNNWSFLFHWFKSPSRITAKIILN